MYLLPAFGIAQNESEGVMYELAQGTHVRRRLLAVSAHVVFQLFTW